MYTIDAKKISIECIGRNMPNTPMLAAAVKASGFMDEKLFLENMEASFKHKFASKPGSHRGQYEGPSKSLPEGGSVQWLKKI